MSIYCTLVMLDESHTEGCASSRDTPTPTKENPTMPENPYRGRQAAYSSAFVWDEGFAAGAADAVAARKEAQELATELAEKRVLHEATKADAARLAEAGDALAQALSPGYDTRYGSKGRKLIGREICEWESALAAHREREKGGSDDLGNVRCVG